MTLVQEIRSGQVWVPKTQGMIGPVAVRILCRYPTFDSGDKTPAWIVEYANYVHRLERIPETTLRTVWRLDQDVNPTDRSA